MRPGRHQRRSLHTAAALVGIDKVGPKRAGARLGVRRRVVATSSPYSPFAVAVAHSVSDRGREEIRVPSGLPHPPEPSAPGCAASANPATHLVTRSSSTAPGYALAASTSCSADTPRSTGWIGEVHAPRRGAVAALLRACSVWTRPARPRSATPPAARAGMGAAAARGAVRIDADAPCARTGVAQYARETLISFWRRRR
jgi:hypothetical protein